MIYEGGSGQDEEEGQELVGVDGVLDVEFGEGRDEVDEVLVGHENAGPPFAGEVVDVLFFEELEVAGLGGLEFPCEVVVGVEGLGEVGPVGDVKHDNIFKIARLEFMNSFKINPHLVILAPGEETTPVSYMMLLLSLHVTILLQEAHQSLEADIPLPLLLPLGLEGGDGLGGGVGGVLLVLWWLLRWLLGWGLGVVDLVGVGLSFALIADLIVDVGVFSCYFLVVHKQGYFTFSVAKFVSVQFHLLLRTDCLGQSLVLYQNIGPLGGKFVPLDFHISDEAITTEQSHQILLIGK